MKVFDDIDDKIFVFESLYNQVLNDHAPIKQFQMRGNQVPYMTDERRKSIRYENMLWKRFINDRTDTNCASYKLQRSRCTLLRRKAIGNFFAKRSEFENPRGKSTL